MKPFVAAVWRLAPGRMMAVLFATVLDGLAATMMLAQLNAILAAEAVTPVDVGILVGLMVLALVAGFTFKWLTSALRGRMSFELRMRLARSTSECSLLGFQDVGASEIMTASTEDVESVAQGTQHVAKVAARIVTVIGGLAYLAWLDYRAILLLLPITLIIAMTLFIMEGYLAKRTHRMREANAGYVGKMRGILRGLTELILHRERRRDYIETGVMGRAAIAKLEAERMGFARAITQTVSTVLIFFVLGAMVVAGRLVGVPPGVIAGALVVCLYLYSMLLDVGESVAVLSRASVSYRFIEELEARLQKLAEPEARFAGMHGPKSIELHEVTFQYPGGGFRVGPFDLNFEAGQISFLVGGNGSGKSTLASVIAGLYPATDGDLVADGTVIDESNVHAYRDHVSAIFFEFHAFDRYWGGTRKGIESLPDRLKEWFLDDRVTVDASGQFSTTNLSQGQKRRLALVSLLADDRQVVIFDEFASDQDPRSKHQFYKTLLPALKEQGKIVIVITHDDRYFALADQRVKLEEGKQATDETRAFMVRLMTK